MIQGHHNSEIETMKASKSSVVNCKNCLPSSSFFLFHDIKLKCSGPDSACSENVTEDQNAIPLLIATILQRIVLKTWWMNMCHPGLSVKRK